MGTRHLIAVQLDGDYRIAQYGQWDGYPSGQGNDVLRFLGAMDRARFEAALRATTFLTVKEIDAINKEIKDKGLSDRWQRHWPHLSRDAGADILQMVADSPQGLKLKNSLSFAADSLSCEWAYVIDLDKNTLEVFKGFNKEPLSDGERFKGVTRSDAADGYAPVKFAASWPLDALPSVEEMQRACAPETEDA